MVTACHLAPLPRNASCKPIDTRLSMLPWPWTCAAVLMAPPLGIYARWVEVPRHNPAPQAREMLLRGLARHGLREDVGRVVLATNLDQLELMPLQGIQSSEFGCLFAHGLT